ncbi:hypothetical protein DWG18_14760 [Lysobacter sp. TY2-98]|uniref:hypothetical protein n=1 Tax=Lysobacter sp. TY2-98 TaxID=2290922 RepID=UPI000E20C6AD|nr:hypothetical protein [Lysobacter sp. TY2-98]AXK73415.1 hypothetical protein DWG18_14760 [Lysobacter sp. TY2-98]
MTTPFTFRLLTTAFVLVGAFAVLTLGATLIRHVATLHGGLALLGWALGFAVLLPVGVAVAAIVGASGLHWPHRPIVPNAGLKVPGAGQ